MSSSRILVVFYSRSGATRKLASTIASSLDADLEEIRDYSNRKGGRGFIRSLVDVICKRPVEIMPAGHDAGAYDLVVIGTPVWAGLPSSPVRAYLAANRGRFRHIALFCSLGGRGSDTAFAAMRALAGRPPLAVCGVTASDVRRCEVDKLIARFTQSLRRKIAILGQVEWMC